MRMNSVSIVIWLCLVILAIYKARKEKESIKWFYTVYLLALGASAFSTIFTFYIFLFCPAVFLPVFYAFQKPFNRYIWRGLGVVSLLSSLLINSLIFELKNYYSIVEMVNYSLMAPTLCMVPLSVASYIETFIRTKTKKPA